MRLLDQRLTELNRCFPVRPPGGWVRTIRKGIGLTEWELGLRLGVSQPRVSQVESAEMDGSLRLGTLERVAAALHCQLRYAFIPRQSLESLADELATLKAWGWQPDGRPGPMDREPHWPPWLQGSSGPHPDADYSTE
jgi:predicted DNA-binding mobile mystery protein A